MSARAAWGVMLGVLFLLAFVAVTAPDIALLPATPPVATAVGADLWNERTIEVVLQGFIILAGVISILLLLGSDRSGEVQP